MKMSLGEKIREMRKLHGMSQEFLAEKLQVSRQSVSKWENDMAEPSCEKLFKLADLFDVSVVELRSPDSKVELVVSVRREIVSMKKSKLFIVVIVLGFLAFISLFIFGIYANASGNYTEETIFNIMMVSAVCMVISFLPIFIAVLRFVYKDCRLNGIRPTFWVVISTTFIGLAYYLIKRDSLISR